MKKQWSIGQILHELSEKKGRYLISLYGGLGIFLGASLSDYYNANIPPNPPSSPQTGLGIPANMAFGIINSAFLIKALNSRQRVPPKLELRPIYSLIVMMSVAAVYMLIAGNPGVIPWIGSHGVLVSLMAGIYFYTPIDPALAAEIEKKKKSPRKLALLVGFLKMRHGDHVKYVDLAILGTIALLTIAAAGLSAALPNIEKMNAYFTFAFVYGFWFAFNFIGVIVGIICQLFQKLTEIDEAIVNMLRSTC